MMKLNADAVSMMDGRVLKGGLDKGLVLVLALTAVKFIVNYSFAGQYGYFRDELYYIACSDHLAWGYVDQPPFSLAALKAVRLLLGETLWAIRLLPALLGAATVFLTGRIARRLGAGPYGQGLAALACLTAPVFLGQSRYYSMNAWDLFFWALAFYIIAVILQEDRPRLWPLFGAVAGLGLLNKYSMGFLCAGLFIGLLASPARRHVKTPWFWLGAAVAGILFLPHAAWEWRNAIPSLEFMHNASRLKNAPMGPAGFFLGQFLEAGPVNAVVWLSGIAFFFLHPKGRPVRTFGWLWVASFALLAVNHPKAYYLSPIYPILFAGGATALEYWTTGKRTRIVRFALPALMMLEGALLAPFTVPILPVDSLFRYGNTLGVSPPQEENSAVGPLPQHFADMFGWEEFAATVASAYETLSPQEKAGCLIYVRNYGEAAAIDFFGRKHGLPKASCAHNSYWFWGPPEWDGKVAVIIGNSLDAGESLRDLQDHFESVVEAGRTSCRFCMPYENNRAFFICRGFKQGSFAAIWPGEKKFI